MMRQSRRYRAHMGLLIAGVGVGICCVLMFGLGTAFAAGANAQQHNGNDSCESASATSQLALAPGMGASITLNHMRGPVGIALVISGTGWPGGAAITIDTYGDDAYGHSHLGQKAIAQATTNSDGTFQTASFAAPINQTCGQGAEYGEPGTFVLFVAHTSDNATTAQARFTYLNSPSLNSSLTPDFDLLPILPGSVAHITGQYWEPHEQVTLTTGTLPGDSLADISNLGGVQPSGQPPVQVQADGNGAFVADVRVPDDVLPQTGFIVNASATGPSYGKVIAAPLVFGILPKNRPTFTADRTQGLPGTIVTLTGTNWSMGTVLVEYCRGQTRESTTTQNGINCDPIASQGIGFALIQGPGSFAIHVTIPPNARPGAITLQARADNDILPDVYTLALPFTILTPSSATPEDLATWDGVHPRLAWALRLSGLALPIVLLANVSAAAVFFLRSRRRAGVAQE